MNILEKESKQNFLHYGEVYSIWQHLQKAKGCLPKYQMLINHCSDEELSSFIQSMIDDVVIPEIKNMEDVIIKNGIEPPPSPSEKPKAKYNEIPVGAKFSDIEAASCVHNDIAMNLATCSQIIGISINEDIAKMFEAHHSQLVKKGGILLKMMKKKNWIVPPPLHIQVPPKK